MIFFISTANFPSTNIATVVGALKIPELEFSKLEQDIQTTIIKNGKSPFMVAQWKKISPSYVNIYNEILDVFLKSETATFCSTIKECKNHTQLVEIIGDLIINNKDEHLNNIFLSGVNETLEFNLKNYLLQHNVSNFTSAIIETKESKCIQLSDVLAGLLYYSINPSLYQTNIDNKGKSEIVKHVLSFPAPNKFQIS